MKNIFIEIYSSNHIGIYPRNNIISKDIAYFVWRDIPFLCYDTTKYFDNFHEYRVQRLQFIAAILLEHTDFPILCFSPFSSITLNLSLQKLKPSLIIEKLEEILNNKLQIKSFDYHSPTTTPLTHREYKKFCSENEFINFQSLKEKNFKKQIEKVSEHYEFSSEIINIKDFKKRLEILSNSSQLLNIALYYFVNTSRLIYNGFIVEAGINLNMVLEALLRDFMFTKNIKDKKKGIKYFNKTLKLKKDFVDWLEELYSARNEFLAHIDENMFTFNERINDPDSYCFEHYGSIAWLVAKYFYYRQNKFSI